LDKEIWRLMGEVHIKSLPGDPYGVAAVPDNTLWARLQEANELLRIAADGRMGAFNIPRRRAVPTNIAVGSDGSVWIIQFWGNRIGRFRGGEFTEFATPTKNAGMSGVAVAEDGTPGFSDVPDAIVDIRGHLVLVFLTLRESDNNVGPAHPALDPADPGINTTLLAFGPKHCGKSGARS
jgi:hypothetical protein